MIHTAARRQAALLMADTGGYVAQAHIAGAPKVSSPRLVVTRRMSMGVAGRRLWRHGGRRPYCSYCNRNWCTRQQSSVSGEPQD
jgi:hypothetical protein